MGEIFNERIFGNNPEFLKYVAGDHSIFDDDDSSIILDKPTMSISIFDYLLMQRLCMLPFETDKAVYDWFGFVAVGEVTVDKWVQKHAGHTYQHMLDGCVVHEDLFNDMNVDVSYLFLALTIPPEPYKELCMQWDDYIELFRSQYATMSKDPGVYLNHLDGSSHGFHTHAHYHLWVTAPAVLEDAPEKHRILRYGPTIPTMINIPEFNANIPYTMISNLGIVDVYLDTAIGPYDNTNMTIWLSGPSVNPAVYPRRYVGETFFSEVYGG